MHCSGFHSGEAQGNAAEGEGFWIKFTVKFMFIMLIREQPMQHWSCCWWCPQGKVRHSCFIPFRGFWSCFVNDGLCWSAKQGLLHSLLTTRRVGGKYLKHICCWVEAVWQQREQWSKHSFGLDSFPWNLWAGWKDPVALASEGLAKDGFYLP